MATPLEAILAFKVGGRGRIFNFRFRKKRKEKISNGDLSLVGGGTLRIDINLPLTIIVQQLASSLSS